ncbi:general substrate transporter [Thamnocephalis sphaerospora]|uniref:General substrate transporter n=1 Tax=Thamnocephalis sphaerospora TaxID=78915 RepID=A0A4P9XN52_9FUNG|nr:general substrate transporter [Thamnocephalis sphaerospora]|eukprot:RKP07358.1 general substrate transporter [Thamnocephalis sphaerospora]
MKNLSVVATLVACFGTFFVGYDAGVMTGMLSVPATEARFGLEQPLVRGIVVSSLYIGAFFGSLGASIPLDRLGRRRAIMLGSVIFAAGVLLQATAFYVEQIIAGRLLAGIAVGIMHSAVPIYIAEIAEEYRRGALATAIEMVLVFGIMVSFLVSLGAYHLDDNVGFRLAFALPILCVPPLIFGMQLLPESPRWLIGKGCTKDALQSLSRLRNLPEDDPILYKEFSQLCSSIENEAQTGEAKFAELLSPCVRKRVLLSLSILVLGETTGLGTIFNFIPDIMRMAGIHRPEVHLLVGAGRSGISMVASGICALLVDRIGRRPLFLAGATCMGAAMGILSALIAVRGFPSVDDQAASYCSIAVVYLFAIGHNISWNSIAYIYATEILPQRLRAKALSISIGIYWLVRTMVVQVAPLLLSLLGWRVFSIFSGICFAIAVGLYFWLPETKGVPLEKMDEVFRDRRLAMSTSSMP